MLIKNIYKSFLVFCGCLLLPRIQLARQNIGAIFLEAIDLGLLLLTSIERRISHRKMMRRKRPSGGALVSLETRKLHGALWC